MVTRDARKDERGGRRKSRRVKDSDDDDDWDVRLCVDLTPSKEARVG